MIALTTEQAQQIEEALEDIVRVFKFETGTPVEALATIRAARAQGQAEQEPEYKGWYCAQCERGVDGSEVTFYEQHEACGRIITDDVPPKPVQQAEQELVAWYDKIHGMEVSVDVSTGEDDDYHRIFGRVDGVMLQSCGSQEDTILVIEDSRNFAAPVRTKDLTDEEIVYLWNMATSDFDFARAVIAKDREKNK